MDPGSSFPSQTEEEMEAREDSWAETVNQFVREQAQKSKPKKAQDQHRAMTVRPNKRKNIRQTCSIPISDTSTLATDPPEKSSPPSLFLDPVSKEICKPVISDHILATDDNLSHSRPFHSFQE